jgi:hypothetical protein
VESKRRALARMRYGGSLAVMLPWLIDDVEEIDEVFGGDAFPYGIEANRPTLQALVAYMAEQRPIPDRGAARAAARGRRDVRGRNKRGAPEGAPSSRIATAMQGGRYAE